MSKQVNLLVCIYGDLNPIIVNLTPRPIKNHIYVKFIQHFASESSKMCIFSGYFYTGKFTSSKHPPSWKKSTPPGRLWENIRYILSYVNLKNL